MVGCDPFFFLVAWSTNNVQVCKCVCAYVPVSLSLPPISFILFAINGTCLLHILNNDEEIENAKWQAIMLRV